MARAGGPAYLTPSPGSQGAPSDESAIGRFIRTELFAPDKLPGNISMAVSFSLFFGGIAAVRMFGEKMIPP